MKKQQEMLAAMVSAPLRGELVRRHELNDKYPKIQPEYLETMKEMRGTNVLLYSMVMYDLLFTRIVLPTVIDPHSGKRRQMSRHTATFKSVMNRAAESIIEGIGEFMSDAYRVVAKKVGDNPETIHADAHARYCPSYSTSDQGRKISLFFDSKATFDPVLRMTNINLMTYMEAQRLEHLKKNCESALVDEKNNTFNKKSMPYASHKAYSLMKSFPSIENREQCNTKENGDLDAPLMKVNPIAQLSDIDTRETVRETKLNPTIKATVSIPFVPYGKPEVTNPVPDEKWCIEFIARLRRYYENKNETRPFPLVEERRNTSTTNSTNNVDQSSYTNDDCDLAPLISKAWTFQNMITSGKNYYRPGENLTLRTLCDMHKYSREYKASALPIGGSYDPNKTPYAAFEVNNCIERSLHFIFKRLRDSVNSFEYVFDGKDEKGNPIKFVGNVPNPYEHLTEDGRIGPHKADVSGCNKNINQQCHANLMQKREQLFEGLRQLGATTEGIVSGGAGCGMLEQDDVTKPADYVHGKLF